MSANLNTILFSLLSLLLLALSICIFSSVDEKSTLLPPVIGVVLPALTESFHPPATNSFIAFSCATFTASVSATPIATFVIRLSPASIPVASIIGPPVIVKPSVVKELFPTLTPFFNVTVSASLNTILFSLLSPLLLALSIRIFSSVDEKSTLLPPVIGVAFPALTESFHSPATNSFIAFSCATFTASVSAVPAATPIICRVIILPPLPVISPTLNAPAVLIHATPSFATEAFKEGS